jgi:hypothetical protein
VHCSLGGLRANVAVRPDGEDLDGETTTSRQEVPSVSILCEKVARKARCVFEPLAHIAPRQKPARNVGRSLLVMNFTDEEGLRGPEDFLATLQDGRFEAFDIDLDQTGQDVLARNGVQSDGVDFDCGFLGDGRIFDKSATVHAGLKAGSLKTQTAISGRYCLRNNAYRVEVIASNVFFDASNI